MGAAAARTASMHDWERLAEKMEDLYEEIISKKGAT
jgi:glycosyltransferase involved in cell wall biosynthesis